MGAQIDGEGTSVITIDGVDELSPARHRIVADRIEAGTLLIAGAITGGCVTVDQCVPAHLQALVDKMRDCGFSLKSDDKSITVDATSEWTSTDISTAPYPAFPTDLQAQFMVLMTQARGTSVITEGIFENRFMHVQELVRLGSACLVLAGLVAKGVTTVNRIYHLDRGYEYLERKLAGLGADVKRVS